jgi:hypothetical protein
MEKIKEWSKFGCLVPPLYNAGDGKKQKRNVKADGWVVLFGGVVVQVCARGETVWAGI